MNIVGPDEIKKLHPFVDTSSLDCALYTEGDGHIDPSSVTNAFVARAKQDFGNSDVFTQAPVI